MFDYLIEPVQGKSFSTIEGEKLEDFFDLCFQNSKFFSLKKSPWHDDVRRDLQIELQPYFIKKIKTDFCYGWDYRKVKGTKDYREIELYIYSASEESKECLLKNVPDIFMGHSSIDRAYRQNIEDLCFYDGLELLVGTVSHEGWISVFSPSKEFEQRLPDFGDWRLLKDCEGEKKALSRFLADITTEVAPVQQKG